MAEQLKLVWRDELKGIQTGTEADLGSVDLLPMLARDGYQPATSTDGSPVEDVITLNPSGTSNDNLAANMQALDAYLSRVADLKEYPNYQSIWVRRQMPGETYARQAYLHEILRPDQIDEAGLFRGQSYLPEYLMGTTRAGWWEGLTFKNYTTADTPISALGGKLAYTGLAGDRPARVGRLQLSSASDLVEFWVGVQTDRLGYTPSAFNPIWHCHHTADHYGYDTADALDASAHDGTKSVITFATHPEMSPRIIFPASESGAANTYQHGRYSLLLRAKCTSTLVANVRLGNGYYGTAGIGQFNTFYRHAIGGTDWKLFPLEEINFPSRPTYGEYTGLAFAALQIEAEKVSGSGNLELDIIGLVPTLDGMVYVKGVNTANGLVYELYQRPTNEVFGKVVFSSAPAIITHEELHPAPRNYGLRPTNGVVVSFAQRSAGSTKADTLSLALDVIERWVTLRGAAGAHP